MARFSCSLPPAAAQQRGAVLIVALVFLLLLTMIGISSMQNATLQEKMAGSVSLRNTTFQLAEAALRVGENAVAKSSYTLAVCNSTTNCAPPATTAVTAAGAGANGVTWVSAQSGTATTVALYGVQFIGTTADPVNFDGEAGTSVKLYRITAIGISGSARTVLESIYAKQ
ncbi:pilus assembly PilX family protein [Pseudomonas typographi]|uniref:Pilus assembly protein PilX n=1 Tax=Pseudomonas typographi TaxID=2715964 RepID=A0ABR7YXN7_9PSED|nr:PilX N-terminal domain-containing pilus assembly protein [Pseudomonas typographi]MBD1551060.1 pilus assembly protein PilX [Pseudomonas typographi]MBD1587973.1 pilus assembly protein PilX [Pseudomonas typographi]MBD1597962.1 pilus assembly protein PilX [Pseudomonas typographi]